MAKKLVIAIDCDDVLVPSAQLIVDTYNNTYDTTVTLNDFYNADSGWQAGGRDEAIRRVDAILRSGATDDITPDPETIDAIKQLASQHELHLVTGRQSYMEPATVKLTHTHFPGCFTSIEYTNYFKAADSTAWQRTKGEVCQQIGADMLIDDHIVHGESVLAAGVKEVIVWGDYPWNRADILVPGMTRSTSWEQVLREVERVAAAK